MNLLNNSNLNLAPPPDRPFSSTPHHHLAFCGGLAGHRPDRPGNEDNNQLKKVLSIILGVIKDKILSFSRSHAHLFDNSIPVLRAISPLAESTDRFFAEQALDFGYELSCFMQSRWQKYKKDFMPENTRIEFAKTFSTAAGPCEKRDQAILH